MSKNLRHELRTAVFKSFAEHQDKHAARAAGQTSGHVFSYSARGALLDVSNNFAGWMRENYPSVRSPQDVQPDHVAEFLQSKQAAGCTTATLATYRSDLAKLGHLVGQDYSAPQICGADRRDDRGAGHAMPAEMVDQLAEYARSHPSGSACAFLVGRETGGRVNDIRRAVYDREKAVIHITGKGGKSYPDRPISAEFGRLMELPAFSRYIGENGRFQLPQADSINKWLSRAETRLFGTSRYSFHDLRRWAAQQHFDERRRAGDDIRAALRDTSQWLNHGPNRDELLRRSYIVVW